MQQIKTNILCTRSLPDELLALAASKDIAIEVLSFIDTKKIETEELRQQINTMAAQPLTVVFTSMNAVEVVTEVLNNVVPDWNIYSIGTTTSKLVTGYFGESALVGQANDALQLANLIIQHRPAAKIVFFCGNIRRDELPDALRNAGIELQEAIVYETSEVAIKTEKKYDGILFFSPSAVNSFFSANTLAEKTILFAIGRTTATAIKQHSKNTIITSDEPGKDNLVYKMMNYFNDGSATINN